VNLAISDAQQKQPAALQNRPATDRALNDMGKDDHSDLLLGPEVPTLSVKRPAFTVPGTARVIGEQEFHRRLSVQPRGTTVHMASTIRGRTSLEFVMARYCEDSDSIRVPDGCPSTKPV
jgi:hypothetical protein